MSYLRIRTWEQYICLLACVQSICCVMRKQYILIALHPISNQVMWTRPRNTTQQVDGYGAHYNSDKIWSNKEEGRIVSYHQQHHHDNRQKWVLFDKLWIVSFLVCWVGAWALKFELLHSGGVVRAATLGWVGSQPSAEWNRAKLALKAAARLETDEIGSRADPESFHQANPKLNSTQDTLTHLLFFLWNILL